MKVLAITQARYGSSRLPAKILKTVNGVTLLDMHLQRVLKARRVTDIVVATTNEENSDKIVEIAKRNEINYYKGSLDDVLERFYFAAKEHEPDYVIRLTSDCPFVDPEVIDSVVEVITREDYDYIGTGLRPTFPDGISIEAFTFKALEKAYKEASLNSEREHVTPYIWKNSSVKGGTLFKSFNYANDVDYSKYRLTVDTQEDFELIKVLVEELGSEKGWLDYVSYLIKNPSVFNINSKFKRNEGYSKSINNDKNE